MIDIHSHLIPNVDDGSRSIQETMKMIKEASKAGFTDIILTPHYMEEAYEPDISSIQFWKEQLQEIVNKEEIGIKLYSGNEVYIEDDTDRAFTQKKFLTLANSNYLLMELPLNSNVKYAKEVIFKLKSMKITPIIAHPERYSYVQEDIELVQDLVELNCLIQCNYGSVIGIYGRQARKTMQKLLKENLVHFLGSDCHRPNTIYAKMNSIIKELKKETTEEQFNRITEENPRRILQN